MLELIDKEAAYIALKREAEAHMLPESHEAYIRAARIIDQMKPVKGKQGRWYVFKNPKWPAYDVLQCSKCKWEIHKSKMNRSDNYFFCPECGSEMLGGVDGASDLCE